MNKTKLVLSILVAIILAGWGIRWVLNQNQQSSRAAKQSQEASEEVQVSLVSSKEFRELAQAENSFERKNAECSVGFSTP